MSVRSRKYIHTPANMGERVADAVAAGMGSWRFIIIQSIIVVCWILLNSLGWFLWKWDAPPFILLNLIFSTQASYAAPIIMMSQNRQATRDRTRDDHEADEVNDLLSNHEMLLTINKQQLEILTVLQPLIRENLHQHPLRYRKPLTYQETILKENPVAYLHHTGEITAPLSDTEQSSYPEEGD